jgi:hypothetical protein
MSRNLQLSAPENLNENIFIEMKKKSVSIMIINYTLC